MDKIDVPDSWIDTNGFRGRQKDKVAICAEWVSQIPHHISKKEQHMKQGRLIQPCTHNRRKVLIVFFCKSKSVYVHTYG